MKGPRAKEERNNPVPTPGETGLRPTPAAALLPSTSVRSLSEGSTLSKTGDHPRRQL